MAELGAGLGSGYPGAIDTDSTLESASTAVRYEVPNDLAAAIIAIQTELGTDPAGSLTDVKTYLQTEHGTNGTHSTALVGMLAGAQTFTGDKTFSGTTTISGTTSITGALTIQTGGLTLNGNVWPSYRAYLSAQQTNVGTGLEKINFNTESFDTNSNYDNATNYRFTPTVAGKYLITARLFFTVIADSDVLRVAIYKNGSSASEVLQNAYGTNSRDIMITDIFDANGTTDYFEIFGANGSNGTDAVNSGAAFSFVAGSRIA